MLEQDGPYLPGEQLGCVILFHCVLSYIALLKSVFNYKRPSVIICLIAFVQFYPTELT